MLFVLIQVDTKLPLVNIDIDDDNIRFSTVESRSAMTKCIDATSLNCLFLVTSGLHYIIGYALIPCKLDFNVTVACSKPVKKNNQISSNGATVIQKTDLTLIQLDTFTCPFKWIRVENQCFIIPQVIAENSSTMATTCAKVSQEIYTLDSYCNGLVCLAEKFVQLINENQAEQLGFITLKHNMKEWTRVYKDGVGMQKSQLPHVELCGKVLLKQAIQCPHGFFVCKDGSCLLEISRCDGIVNCIDGEDEVGCLYICTQPGLDNTCADCSITNGCHCKATFFQCSSGGCVSASTLCDGIPLCADESDEALCETQRTDTMQCPNTKTNSFCVDCPNSVKRLMSLCVYSAEIDPYSHEASARLTQCERFQCSGADFKCWRSYCVPVHYLCDQHCDCPVCQDEEFCWPGSKESNILNHLEISNLITDQDNAGISNIITNQTSMNISCPGLIKCKLGSNCVSSDYHMDGTNQCKLSMDDEVIYPNCPQHCTCHGTAISFSNQGLQQPQALENNLQLFTAVSISNLLYNRIVNLKEIFHGCPKCKPLNLLDISSISNWHNDLLTDIPRAWEHLKIINISYNSLATVQHVMIKQFPFLINFYAHHCNVSTVSVGTFIATTLHTLDLSYNFITSLQETWLSLALNLRQLFLQFNKINFVELYVFKDASELRHVDLRGNPIALGSINPNHWSARQVEGIGKSLSLQTFLSDFNYLCCVVKTANFCLPLPNPYHNCLSLYPPTHQPINPSTHQPIHPSTHPPIYPSTHHPIRQSVCPSVYPLAYLLL